VGAPFVRPDTVIVWLSYQQKPTLKLISFIVALVVALCTMILWTVSD
jgi:hypothetical protein